MKGWPLAIANHAQRGGEGHWKTRLLDGVIREERELHPSCLFLQRFLRRGRGRGNLIALYVLPMKDRGKGEKRREGKG